MLQHYKLCVLSNHVTETTVALKSKYCFKMFGSAWTAKTWRSRLCSLGSRTQRIHVCMLSSSLVIPLIHHITTNSMEQRYSWEAKVRSASQGITRLYPK
jgi:hypothetical protein